MKDKEFYLLIIAAEEDKAKLERTADTFQGFFDCLDNYTLKGVVYGPGVWKAGDIEGKPALQEAYETGKNI